MADVYTQAGEEKIVDIIDGTAAVPTYRVGWGTGAGTHSKSSTTLFTEASEARVATTQSQPVADKNRFLGTITAAANKTITNAGLFDAASGGTLIVAGDFAGIALNTGDKIEFTIELEQT